MRVYMSRDIMKTIITQLGRYLNDNYKIAFAIFFTVNVIDRWIVKIGLATVYLSSLIAKIIVNW